MAGDGRALPQNGLIALQDGKTSKASKSTLKSRKEALIRLTWDRTMRWSKSLIAARTVIQAVCGSSNRRWRRLAVVTCYLRSSPAQRVLTPSTRRPVGVKSILDRRRWSLSFPFAESPLVHP
jgi:hypothetical protein